MLFAPYGGDYFLEEIMGQSALYLSGAVGRLDHLISWSDLNYLLEFGGLSFPRLRLLKGAEELPEAAYLRTGRSGYPRPIVRELTSQLSDGAVLAIQSVDDIWEPIAALCQTMERRLRLPVQADLFANCYDAPIPPLRWNDQDVIVLQVEGRRDWRVHCPTASLPIGAPVPTGAAEWHGMLSGNDLLYVPRGWWYLDSPIGNHDYVWR